MKVLNIVHHLVNGGIESWLLSMLREAQRTEWQMDVCCKGPARGERYMEAEECGARVFHCPLTPSHVRHLAALRQLIRENGYDLLHAHTEAYSGVAAWAVRGLGVPLVASFHNTRFDPQSWPALPGVRALRKLYGALSIRYALVHAEHVTGCSAAVLRALERYGPVRARCSVLPYGVDLPCLASARQRAEFRWQMGWPAEAPIVVQVGRFARQKNHALGLEAFRRARASVPDARLLLVGSGTLEAETRRRAAVAGLDGTVRFLGERADVRDLLPLCDVLLLPSRYEGFPMVALEANAAALPVVGSRVPGLAEAVEDGVTAVLHRPDDAAGMAESLANLLGDREAAQRLGRAGRARAAAYSTAASFRKLTELYGECAGKR